MKVSVTTGIAVLVAALALTACSDPNQEQELRADPKLAPQQLEHQQMTRPASVPTVEVALIDHRIQMPAEVAAGEMELAVANHGGEPHSLTLEGEGVNVSLPQPLAPHESATLRTHLPPGTYLVYCPLDDHRERGMSLQLTAVPTEPNQRDSGLNLPNSTDR